MDSRKIVLKNLFIGQQWRNRHREQTYGHGERGGEDDICGKSNIEIYITICKIGGQWKFTLCPIFHSSCEGKLGIALE